MNVLNLLFHLRFGDLPSEEREQYITTLPLVMKDGENDDPHARQRARAQFEVAPIEGSQSESE